MGGLTVWCAYSFVAWCVTFFLLALMRVQGFKQELGSCHGISCEISLHYIHNFISIGDILSFSSFSKYKKSFVWNINACLIDKLHYLCLFSDMITDLCYKTFSFCSIRAIKKCINVLYY